MKIAVVFFLFCAACYFTHRLYLAHFRKKAFSGLSYTVKVSHDERFGGETVSFSQTITNNRAYPIPCLKVETTLPTGLWFLLPDGKEGERRSTHVDSVFFLPAQSSVTRTWFLYCENRGEYQFGDVMLLTEEPFGMLSISERMKGDARLRILPRPEEKLCGFALQDFYQSSHSRSKGFLPERSLVRSTREYTASDTFRDIHFKVSARQGKLMVKEYDHQKTDIYNVILNMQSRIMEPHGGLTISRPDHIEDCIRICASLLDSAAAEQVPITLYANTRSEEEGALFCSGDFCGQDELPAAYRMLAAIPMEMSMQTEKMLDLILSDPGVYARGGKLAFVSAYLDRRMLQFAENMQKHGVETAFFITTTYQNDESIPEKGVTVYVRYPSGDYREVYHEANRAT
ncbi:MAG: DUF58 domain-containing protein [Clostridia bacterium]|nr:DUF58 domain-containing protein [Clostridia bacterium]